MLGFVDVFVLLDTLEPLLERRSESTGRVGYVISVSMVGEWVRVGGEGNMRFMKLVMGEKRPPPPAFAGNSCCSMEFWSWASICRCLVIGDRD